MDYSELSREQRIQMCKSRIAGYEQEHFGHTLNRRALEALPDEDTGKAQALKETDAALATLDASIAAVTELLADLQGQQGK